MKPHVLSKKQEKDILAYVRKYPQKTLREVAAAFNVQWYDVNNLKKRHGIPNNSANPRTDVRTVEEAIQFEEARKKTKEDRHQYEFLVSEVQKLTRERDALLHLQAGPAITEIKPSFGSGTSEATYFMVASDWHIEERVRSQEVNALNEYTLDIAKLRGTQFFQKGLRLLRMFAQDVRIDHCVLPLLGDFITGNIHEEFMETTQLSPSDAIWEVYNIIASGIDFLLNQTKVDLIIPCKSGNHGRITKDQRHATEEGNSLESFMYHSLARHYENEKRVNFILSDGYHIYLDVYGEPIRFHHGHAMNYGGGVGGIYIPVNKAIAQWNKARRAALDVFGHFHQFRDGGNFVSNGSMIGYNSYALSIKAEFEKPKQASFLIDKKRGKTVVAPILFEQQPKHLLLPHTV